MNTDRPGFYAGRDIHTGLPESLGLPSGTCLPPEVLEQMRQRALAPARPTESTARRMLKILRAWPRLLGAWAAIMIVYYSTPASRPHASERGEGIAVGVALLVVAAAALARRRRRSRSCRLPPRRDST
jgi:MYXO-CTERM domain-containing protein